MTSKTSMPDRPVSADEFHRALGELRRRQDERDQVGEKRHLENIDRFKVTDHKIDSMKRKLEEHAEKDIREIGAIHEELKKNTEKTEAGNKVAEDTKKSVEGLVQLFNSAKGAVYIGKGFGRFILWGAGCALALASIVGAIAYLLGRGPMPPLH